MLFSSTSKNAKLRAFNRLLTLMAAKMTGFTVPVVSLVTSESCAVDPRLLASTNANHLVHTLQVYNHNTTHTSCYCYWWDWPFTWWTDQLLSFSARHCWLGHLTRKNRPRYDLFGVWWDVKPYSTTIVTGNYRPKNIHLISSVLQQITQCSSMSLASSHQ